MISLPAPTVRGLRAFLTICLATIASLRAATAEPTRLSLDGKWEVRQQGTEDVIPALVPGNVHTDLLAAGKIPDPFFGDNESKLQWIGKATWVYSREFDVPKELLERQNVVLRCEGLDTLATVKVNGTEIAKTDNMFRVWEFDVRDLLKPGKNSIEISFAPAREFIEANYEDPAFPGLGAHKTSNLRKEACDFGWDWGPDLLTCGIWRPISLVAWDHARLDGVLIQQSLTDPKTAYLDLDIAVDTDGSIPLTAEATVTDEGGEVGKASVPLRQKDGVGRATVAIPDPKRWWPAGMGDQHLYTVSVVIKDDSGAVIDQTKKRIGLREIGWLAKTDDRPLGLSINGRPFFAKGANWIPPDTFTSRITPEKLRRYMEDAVAANMNMMRFWGGGYYEEDELFDICDELGILVWMDFKFACAAYPSWDPAFCANVKAELEDNIERLRHHPSIAVWCGNNEVRLHYFTADRGEVGKMSYADYDRFFADLIGGTLRQLAPQAVYTPGSPEAGDDHFWGVWHGNQPFEAYEELHGMLTEYGFQSFPHPRTVDSFTTEADRESLETPVMMAHQKAGDQGNAKIAGMIERYFRAPKDFESTMWLSQVTQAFGITKGIDHWRRDWPNSTGSLVWQFNDTWPGPTWSMVDYFGRWKALMYRIRHAYSPIRISGVPGKDGGVDVFIASDVDGEREVDFEWMLTDLSGKKLESGAGKAAVPAGTASAKVAKLKLGDAIDKAGKDNVLLWLSASENGETVSRNVVLFDKPKNLTLPDPEIQTTINPTDDGVFAVTLEAKRPALWVWLDVTGVDAKYSDNFVDLRPGVPVTIEVTPAEPISEAEFREKLAVRSLRDTYDPSQPVRNLVVEKDGVLRAMAADADIEGFSAGVDTQDPPSIGSWEDARDSVTWKMKIDKPGTYSVTVESAIPASDAGSTYEVTLGDQRVEAVVPATERWEDFVSTKIGTFTVREPGTYPLTVKAVSKKHRFVMNLRSVTLERETP